MLSLIRQSESNSLHNFIILGMTQRLKEMLQQKPLLNATNEFGWTPLHVAVIIQNKEIVQILIDQGADLEVFDNDNMTPLAYAVTNKDTNIIGALLKAGANPFARVSEAFQVNIVMLARTEKGEDTPCSLYLEKHMSLAKDYLARIAKEFRAMLHQQIIIAKKTGKKVLVILGESHGHYKIEQVEKLMICTAKVLGIETAYLELPKDAPTVFTPALHYAKNKMRMNVIGIDDHPQRGKGATTKERSIIMAKRIKEIDQNALLITGNYHLLHFIVDKNSQIDRNHFHIIPINLGALTEENNLVDKAFEAEEQFSTDPKKVIQINSIGMSDYEAVLTILNRTLPLVSAPIKFLLPTLYEVIKDSPEKVKMFGALRHEKETMGILKKFNFHQCFKFNILLNDNLNKFLAFTPLTRQTFLKYCLKKWVTPIVHACVLPSSIRVSGRMVAPSVSNPAAIIHSYHAAKQSAPARVMGSKRKYSEYSRTL